MSNLKDIKEKEKLELEQYRAIGTVQECQEAREKQKPKIPDYWGGMGMIPKVARL